MQCGQTMPAIGVSNSNQFGLVRRVYSIACLIQNHTHISIIFMHAWVTNIMISYSNIWIHFYIDYHLYVSLLHPHAHSSSLCEYIPLTFLSCMHIYMHIHSPLGILYIAHTRSRSLGRSPTISLGLSICIFPTHTDRYTPLARSA